jgi:hypothetical protein
LARAATLQSGQVLQALERGAIAAHLAPRFAGRAALQHTSITQGPAFRRSGQSPSLHVDQSSRTAASPPEMNR